MYIFSDSVRPSKHSSPEGPKSKGSKTVGGTVARGHSAETGTAHDKRTANIANGNCSNA